METLGFKKTSLTVPILMQPDVGQIIFFSVKNVVFHFPDIRLFILCTNSKSQPKIIQEFRLYIKKFYASNFCYVRCIHFTAKFTLWKQFTVHCSRL